MGELDIIVPSDLAGAQTVNIRFTYDINGILKVDAMTSANEFKSIIISNKKNSSLTLAQEIEKLNKFELQNDDFNKYVDNLLEKANSLYKDSTSLSKADFSNKIQFFLSKLSTDSLLHRQKTLSWFEDEIHYFEQNESILDIWDDWNF